MKTYLLILLLPFLVCGCATTTSNASKDKPPRLLQIVEASFPDEYTGDKKTKEVIVEISVDETGMITDAFIHSSPDPQLNEVAIITAKKFKVSPMISNGEKVPTKMRVPVTIKK